jgi:hypothetical protein
MRSTIKETKYPKTDAKGSSCLVVLNDGTDGFFNYKGAFPFTVGQEVEYTATKTEKKTKPGEFYNVLKLEAVGQASQPQSNPQPNKAIVKVPLSGSEIKNHKVQASISALEFIISAYNADKVKWDEVAAKQKECTTILFTDIDEIYSEK